MIEMRWNNGILSGDCTVNYHNNPKILQYRQMVDKGTYAGIGPYPMGKLEWSEWKTVPEVLDNG